MKSNPTGPVGLPPSTRVSSIFIDESGSKNSAGGFFVLGFVKSRNTPMLQRQIRDVRQRHQHYKEIKFGSICRKNMPFYFDVVEILATADVRVGGSVYDAGRNFGSEPTWLVQTQMAARLVRGNVNKGEIVNVFLDVVSTPRGESVAKGVKDSVNGTLEAHVVVAAYDLDSQATDLLQLADLVSGAIAYERKQRRMTGMESISSPKSQVAARMRRAFGLESFDDVQRGKVNILTMGA